MKRVLFESDWIGAEARLGGVSMWDYRGSKPDGRLELEFGT